ncbi:MAG: hypothetical protein IBV52_05080 [Candidatus Bathyarchaeota archaeon]
MSERAYFGLRYAVPGYTFILILIITNAVPLIQILDRTGKPEIFAALLAFTSLLTGSALGFLVSQFYWWRFNKNGGILGINEIKGVGDAIGHGYVPPKEEKEKKKVTAAILDFVIYLQEKPLLNYVWRRWDIYHLLVATYYTLWMGLLSGIITRIILFEMFIFKTNFFVSQTYERYLSIANVEGATLVLIVLGTLFLLFVLKQAQKSLIENYRPALEAIVRDSMHIDKLRLRKAFPKYFPKEKGIDE